MKYYKRTENGYILAIGTNMGGTEITEEEYDEILAVLQTKPQDTETVGYRLKEDLTWEQYQKEPQPEPDSQPKPEPQPDQDAQPEPDAQPFSEELINKLDNSISRLIETIQASNLQSNSIADVGNDTLTRADEIMKSIIRPDGQKEGG